MQQLHYEHVGSAAFVRDLDLLLPGHMLQLSVVAGHAQSAHGQALVCGWAGAYTPGGTTVMGFKTSAEEPRALYHVHNENPHDEGFTHLTEQASMLKIGVVLTAKVETFSAELHWVIVQSFVFINTAVAAAQFAEMRTFTNAALLKYVFKYHNGVVYSPFRLVTTFPGLWLPSAKLLLGHIHHLEATPMRGVAQDLPLVLPGGAPDGGDVRLYAATAELMDDAEIAARTQLHGPAPPDFQFSGGFLAGLPRSGKFMAVVNYAFQMRHMPAAPCPQAGRVLSQATLFVVTPHSFRRREQQLRQFVSHVCRVVMIETLAQWRATTWGAIAHADFILLSADVLCSFEYRAQCVALCLNAEAQPGRFVACVRAMLELPADTAEHVAVCKFLRQHDANSADAAAQHEDWNPAVGLSNAQLSSTFRIRRPGMQGAGMLPSVHVHPDMIRLFLHQQGALLRSEFAGAALAALRRPMFQMCYFKRVVYADIHAAYVPAGSALTAYVHMDHTKLTAAYRWVLDSAHDAHFGARVPMWTCLMQPNLTRALERLDTTHVDPCQMFVRYLERTILVHDGTPAPPSIWLTQSMACPMHERVFRSFMPRGVTADGEDIFQLLNANTTQFVFGSREHVVTGILMCREMVQLKHEFELARHGSADDDEDDDDDDDDDGDADEDEDATEAEGDDVDESTDDEPDADAVNDADADVEEDDETAWYGSEYGGEDDDDEGEIIRFEVNGTEMRVFRIAADTDNDDDDDAAAAVRTPAISVDSQLALCERLRRESSTDPCPVCCCSAATAYLSCGHAMCPECMMAIFHADGAETDSHCPACMQVPHEQPPMFFIILDDARTLPGLPVWAGPECLPEWQRLHYEGRDLSVLFWLRAHAARGDPIAIIAEDGTTAFCIRTYLNSKLADTRHVDVMSRVQLESGYVCADACVALVLLKRLPRTEDLIRASCPAVLAICSFAAE